MQDVNRQAAPDHHRRTHVHMYFIILEAKPLRSNPRHEEFGGAFAACWVATDDQAVAEREARSVLADAGWEAKAVDEHYPVERERYLGNAESLGWYDQAARDGVCINLNTWRRRRRGSAGNEERTT
jgi:hypothetical protein